jgi:uncharacterized protein YjbI with pentapeptide repeats
VIGWTSSDRGLNWVRLPFTEGVFVSSDSRGVDADIRLPADGSVLLVAAARASGQTPLERSALARVSRAGAVFDSDQCILSPGVVCPFAALAGARLDGASLDESIAGAVLDGASLRYARISIDPSAPPIHFDFAGLDLTGAYFSSEEYESPAPMQADFTSAHLDRAVFSDIDLTGIDLRRHQILRPAQHPAPAMTSRAASSP